MNEIEQTLRDAWNRGGEPSLADQAQQLADSGKDSSAIYDGLEALLLHVRAAGADDTVEEGVMNVMDRVGGWCHESRAIIGHQKPAFPIRAA